MKHSNEKKSCYCNDQATLIIDRNSASRIVAGLLLGAFFIFTAGYFLGKRASAEETILQTERTAFADQLSYAMNSAYNPSMHNESTLEQENNEKIVAEKIPQQESPEPTLVVPADLAGTTQETIDATHYQAYLLGGTKKLVSQFVERLQKKGIDLQLKQRSSRTAHGKMIHWYQAVTALYLDKNELMSVLDTVKKIEKIKDVQIVSMRSSVNAEKKGNS